MCYNDHYSVIVESKAFCGVFFFVSFSTIPLRCLFYSLMEAPFARNGLFTMVYTMNA